jgi:hypothetical protein
VGRGGASESSKARADPDGLGEVFLEVDQDPNPETLNPKTLNTKPLYPGDHWEWWETLNPETLNTNPLYPGDHWEWRETLNPETLNTKPLYPGDHWEWWELGGATRVTHWDPISITCETPGARIWCIYQENYDGIWDSDDEDDTPVEAKWFEYTGENDPQTLTSKP